MTSLDETLHQLCDAIKLAQRGPIDVPPHLVCRIGVLLGAERAVFVDAALETTGSRVCSGRIVVFTPTRIIYATAENAPIDPHPQQRSTYTVEVESWPRRDLTAVGLRSDAEHNANPDNRWDPPLDVAWPDDAKISLTYRGRPPITLPSGQYITPRHAKTLAAFIPPLLADLSNDVTAGDNVGSEL